VQKVPIEMVKPGMVLAKSVTSDSGMALCGEGTELTETIIERLKQKNISHLTLKGHPVDLGGETKTTEQKIQDLTGRFSRVQGDPLMQKILTAAQSALIALEEERAADDAAEGGGS